MGESFLRRLQQGRLRRVRACKWQDALAGIRRRVRDAERRRSDRALRRGRGSLADVPVRAPELSARPVLSVHRRVDDGQPARGVEPVLLHVHETERLSEIWRVVRRVLHVDQSVHLQSCRLQLGRRGRRRVRAVADDCRRSGACRLLRHGFQRVARRDAASRPGRSDSAACRRAELFRAVRRSA